MADDLVDKGDLLLIQRLVIGEGGKGIHGGLVVQLGDLPHQQSKGGIPKFPLVVLPAAQLAGEHMLQLLIVAGGHGDVVGQLVNGHGVPVLIDVAVDLGPVVLEIVGRLQLHSLLALGHRIGKAGDHKWNAGAVRSILTNEKYKGDALLQKSYTVDFLTKKKKVNEGEIPQYYVEGNHEAIIQPEVFELVQQELERRKQGRGRHSGVHLFSGKIRCGQCGEWYGSKVWHSTDKYRRVIWQCNHKYDGEEKCSTPHLTEDEIKAMFVTAANKLIGKKAAIISPLRASLDIAFDTSALEAETEKLQEELMVASDLIQKCIYENAHVALDQTEYQKRYDGLTARFDSAKAQLEEIDSAIADKKSRRAAIEAFLDTLAQADLMEKFDPALWCGLVDFVAVYDKDDVRITFKNGQEIKT